MHTSNEIIQISALMILGLDPAGPVFARRPRKARLDSSDARFVDVIHTSFNYLVGIMGRCGDVDFYVNGGGKQPGCWPKRKLISAFFRALHVALHGYWSTPIITQAQTTWILA